MEQTAKEVLIQQIRIQPDDSSTSEILQELLFQQVIIEGLEDEREGRMMSHEELGKIIRSWEK